MAITSDIILLNGTSSSGKTSIARALQESMDIVVYHFSLDRFYAMLPAKVLKQIFKSQTTANESAMDWHKFWVGFYRAAYAVAKADNLVVIDSICYGRILDLCLEIFKDISLVYVGVKCPLNVLQERELHRGNRIIGMAESQYDCVHNDQQYDIEMDTSVVNPLDCADKIINWLKSGRTPQAFDMMRNRGKISGKL